MKSCVLSSEDLYGETYGVALLMKYLASRSGSGRTKALWTNALSGALCLSAGRYLLTSGDQRGC